MVSEALPASRRYRTMLPYRSRKHSRTATHCDWMVPAPSSVTHSAIWYTSRLAGPQPHRKMAYRSRLDAGSRPTANVLTPIGGVQASSLPGYRLTWSDQGATAGE